MGMIDRYKKAGGFIQLLNLLETCGPQKQEKFLALIREENPRWAEAIESRLLSIQRIFSWNPETIAEVLGNLQDLTIAVALHGIDDAKRETIYSQFSHIKRRKIQDLFNEKQPTPAEVSTMFGKILTEVRKMISDGHLRPEKFDPSLVIEDEIEDKLARATEDASLSEGAPLNFDLALMLNSDNASHASANSSGQSSNSSHSAKSAEAAEEVQFLKRKVIVLSKENSTLKHENVQLKHKLDQIRKIV